MKNKNLLVTGGYGFLGRNVAKFFACLGYSVYGIGHGHWTKDEYSKFGFENWSENDINITGIRDFGINFNVIVHCGGSGSVAYSISNPHEDYNKTVSGTASVLEYIRLYNPEAKLIYPSSPAVHGEHANTPIKEDDPLCPASPYGEFKLMAEHLCHTYSRNFAVDVIILRLFSVFGEGLTKQLLWDASNKLINSNQAVFWGSGSETRDWIHVDDAVRLINSVITSDLKPSSIVNAGSGQTTTIKEVISLLAKELGCATDVQFNKVVKQGDPLYYWSDITKARAIGWSPTVRLSDGIKRYAEWFLHQKK